MITLIIIWLTCVLVPIIGTIATLTRNKRRKVK